MRHRSTYFHFRIAIQRIHINCSSHLAVSKKPFSTLSKHIHSNYKSAVDCHANERHAIEMIPSSFNYVNRELWIVNCEWKCARCAADYLCVCVCLCIELLSLGVQGSKQSLAMNLKLRIVAAWMVFRIADSHT